MNKHNDSQVQNHNNLSAPEAVLMKEQEKQSETGSLSPEQAELPKSVSRRPRRALTIQQCAEALSHFSERWSLR
jgi:hypothetical protein